MTCSAHGWSVPCASCALANRRAIVRGLARYRLGRIGLDLVTLVRLAQYALLVAFLLLLPTRAYAQQECESTCLDVCQTEGDDFVAACSCNWGGGQECGCICASFVGTHNCDDFPGCTQATAFVGACSRSPRNDLRARPWPLFARNDAPSSALDLSPESA